MTFNYIRLLKVGMTGADVRELQTSLNYLGFSAGSADGIFGSRTRAAVVSFQQSRGLATDGIVGPNTARAINQALAEGTTPSPTPSTYLRLGSKGPEVAALQTSLNTLGYNAGAPDGVFGPKTQAAVIAFQKDAGIVVDGVVGPSTQATIAKSLKWLETTECILNTARPFVGYAYQYGGESPSEGGFDCSGFTQYVFGKCGISLPRTASEQYNVGTPVAFEYLRPGDLVFFDIQENGTIGHVGIYIGDNAFIHASNPRTDVMISTLETYWLSHFAGAKRVY